MVNLTTTDEDILGFILARADEGLASALVTLTAIQGSSPRSIGAQMAICEDGRYLGSYSGGCIEAAVVAEALKAIDEKRVMLVRFGAGSPYLDVRLPCGGGIDLLFTPVFDVTAIAQAHALLMERRACGLTLSTSGIEATNYFGDYSGDCSGEPGWHDDVFTLYYVPRLRIIAIGQGEELIAAARLAHFFGTKTQALSPAQRDIALLQGSGIAATHLAYRTTPPVLESDPWTAIIFIFHDHDWEEALLPRALELPQFYVGAVGSRRTHAARLDMLRAAGVDGAALAMLRPRVGLIPSTRDPATLALSLISEIVQEYGKLRV